VSAQTARHYYLHLAIPGWQGRVEDHYPVELRDAMTHATVITLESAVVVAALTNYVNHAQITAELLERRPSIAAPRLPLASAPSRTAPRALGVPLRPVQEARRAARAKRSKRPA
jgi:hypothetical protein